MGTSSLRIAGRSWGRKAGGCFALASLFLITACGGSAHGTPTPSGSTDYRQFVDAQHGFIIVFPGAWNTYTQPNDPGVDFVAGPNEHNFVEVRVFSNLPISFSPSDTQTMKAVADQLLAGTPIDVINATQVTINGIPGWQYTYTFNDPNPSKLGVGVHVHLFLFQGNRIHTLIFQALPRSNFNKLAPTFQKILNSYRALPLASPSPGTSPTATPTP